MKLGVMLSGDVAAMPARARLAEDIGVESVWLAEHLAWPTENDSTYPYTESGRAPVQDGRFATQDPWVALAAIAHATERVRLGTSVYVLPLRDPHVTARAVSTLDVLSGGRTELGIGVGWLEEEFVAVGQHFRTRGARTNEIVQILRGLFSDGDYAHEGDHYSFPSLCFEPKPPQGDLLPILAGGESAPALRRAATVADGWIGLRHTPETAAAKVATLRELRAGGPRSGTPFSVTVGVSRNTDKDAVAAYRDAGVDRICVPPWRRDEEPEQGIAQLAELVAICADIGPHDFPLA
ncbi:TIGR03619 family F420-dependent LLM class oxidoreductase [Rhodococcoides yunnanense]|uniref:TIGR03619 family F420-dependent LLM class oxidoreductase n=1 Tax=Rhodococcoides yunnanense TaxID=278209 RepID=UPI0009325821|nr:TIGR03619 family F420-dependent LLM class oxidoreductase [Rhodococcus yunnanensis]